MNGSTPISRGSLTYVDDGLSNGTTYCYSITYCYGITAVDVAGNESAILTSDAPALSPLAGLTNGTNTKPGQTTALDTQFNPELTLTFKVYDEVSADNELAYMIVTGTVKNVMYQDNDGTPDRLTLTVSPTDFADTPGSFTDEGGLYISFFSKAFQGGGSVPNAVFANNVYASDIESSADLSQLSQMAGIKVNGTDGNPAYLKFYFNKADADAAWGTASASDIGGARETGTGTGSFESIAATTGTDASNFDLDFDGSAEDTYVVDLSNSQWSTRFVTAGVSSAVPVELTTFEGVAGTAGVTLRWATASETNNAGFEIERKQANGPFQQVGYVEGHGTTTSEQTYRYTDTELADVTGTVVYRLKQIDLDGSFEYSPEVELDVGVPARFALRAPYPNPFTQSATIRYELPRAADVRLVVYDVLGRRVATLVDGPRPAGRQAVTFNAQDLSSGLYLVRMQAESFMATQRVTLTR